MRGAAQPCHGSSGLCAWADGGLSKPTWGAGVGPLSPELLEEQFVLQGLQPGWKESDRHQHSPGACCSCFLLSEGSSREGLSSLAPPLSCLALHMVTRSVGQQLPMDTC